MKTTCWMPTTWLPYYLFIEKDLVDLVEQSFSWNVWEPSKKV